MIDLDSVIRGRPKMDPIEELRWNIRPAEVLLEQANLGRVAQEAVVVVDIQPRSIPKYVRAIRERSIFLQDHGLRGREIELERHDCVLIRQGAGSLAEARIKCHGC